MSYNVKLYRK